MQFTFRPLLPVSAALAVAAPAAANEYLIAPLTAEPTEIAEGQSTNIRVGIHRAPGSDRWRPAKATAQPPVILDIAARTEDWDCFTVGSVQKLPISPRQPVPGLTVRTVIIPAGQAERVVTLEAKAKPSCVLPKSIGIFVWRPGQPPATGCYANACQYVVVRVSSPP